MCPITKNWQSQINICFFKGKTWMEKNEPVTYLQRVIVRKERERESVVSHSKRRRYFPNLFSHFNFCYDFFSTDLLQPARPLLQLKLEIITCLILIKSYYSWTPILKVVSKNTRKFNNLEWLFGAT